MAIASATFTLVLPAYAQLNVCNRTSEAIYVSARLYVNDEWITYMNRRVDGATCKEIITEPLKNRYLHLFARSSSLKWSGDGPNFCVRLKNIVGSMTEKYCQNHDEYDEEDFISIDRGVGKTSYGIAFQTGQPSYEAILRPGEVPPPLSATPGTSGTAPPGVTNRSRSGLRRGNPDTPPPPPPPPPPPTSRTQPAGPECFPSARCIAVAAILANKVVYRNSCDHVVNVTLGSTCNGHNLLGRETIQISPNGTGEVDRFVSSCSPLGGNTFTRWIDKACR